jgi:hypothetical protein
MSLETMTKLATTTLSTSAASVTFSNIPQTYTDLRISVSGRTTGGVGDSSELGTISFGFGSTSYTYSERIFGANGTAAYSTSNSVAATSQPIYWLNGSGSTASIFASVNIDIPNYTSNNVKNFSYETAPEYNDTTLRLMLGGVSTTKTDPVTDIILTAGQTAFAQHSTFTLYGIKNARQTAGNSIKATGGNISFDGTYVVHTFNTSGTFTPSVPILADYLVVAGGGGGGGIVGGGGGAGAGAIGAYSLAGGTSYTVTIGAGGAGSASGDASSSDGSNSIFYNATVNGGGGGGSHIGGNVGQVGRSGGNGGGGAPGNASSYNGGSSNQSAITGATIYGNAGGVSSTGDNPYRGGGGGGGGAAGISGETSGNGGNGFSSSISGSSVTYAGGGGGSFYNGSPAGTGGTGGGGAGSSGTTMSGTAGTANTGGGGGAGGSTGYPGGAGGSGIVIIRYRAVA